MRRHRRRIHLISVVTTSVMLGAIGTPAHAAPTLPARPPTILETARAMLDRPAGSLPPTVSTALAPAADLAPTSSLEPANSLELAGIDGSAIGDEARVPVAVHVDARRNGQVLGAMDFLGATVTYDAGSTIFAELGADAATLTALGSLDGVLFVEPDPVLEIAAGPTTTEGLGMVGTGPWHGAGITGSSVDIAIVDGGFAGYAARQAAGDLPASAQLVTQSYCPSFEGLTHGTGVAEVVHDVAPGARLHLICVSTLGNLLQAKDYILDPVNGIDVVQLSGGWYGTSRGGSRDDDLDGAIDTPAEVVAAVRGAGVLWVNAAGNDAQRHWGGGWADANNDDVLDLAPGGVVSKASAGVLVVVLRWDDWPVGGPDPTPTDLDLGLFCGATLVASSTNVQSGTQPPVEALGVTGSCPSAITLRVVDFLGTAPQGMRLDVWLTGDAASGLSQAVAGGSVTEPASQQAATTVGAVNVATGVLAPYSSYGPNLDGASTPLLSAPDCVSTTALGARSASVLSGFCGTSAAAPHVSGAAALLLQAEPSLRVDPALLEQALANRTVPNPAPAAAVGRGLLALGAVPSAVPTTPGAPANVTAVLTGTPGAVSVSWSEPPSGGSPIAGYRVRTLPNGPTVDVGAAVRSAIVVNLTPGIALTFTVTASNVIGPGPESPASNAVTVPAPSGPSPVAPASTRAGYWMLGSDGTVYPFGDARHHGDLSAILRQIGDVEGTRPADLERTASGNGYVIATEPGTISGYGDGQAASTFPVTRALILAPGEWVMSLSLTPSGRGVWLFTNRGQVGTSGDAGFFGDLKGTVLNGPVLDSIPTQTGKGYYMVASDGGNFAFGDAAFHGSMGGRALNSPVQSLVPTATGAGYWLVASDGGIFAFGDAGFVGSIPGVLAAGQKLNRAITGMVRYGTGYLMVGEDGGIFSFSDRPFLGSLGSTPPLRPIVAVAQLG